MVSCKFARHFQGPSKVSCKFVRRQRRRLLVHADWNHARDGVASVIPAGKLLATPSILTRIKVYNKRRRRFNLSKRFLTKDGVASILPRGARLATASQRTFPRGRIKKQRRKLSAIRHETLSEERKTLLMVV